MKIPIYECTGNLLVDKKINIRRDLVLSPGIDRIRLVAQQPQQFQQPSIRDLLVTR